MCYARIGRNPDFSADALNLQCGQNFLASPYFTAMMAKLLTETANLKQRRTPGGPVTAVRKFFPIFDHVKFMLARTIFRPVASRLRTPPPWSGIRIAHINCSANHSASG